MTVTEVGHRRLEDLLIDCAGGTPDALAVTGPDGSFTYCELDRLADHMADRLRRLGVGRGDRVVLWLEKLGRGVAVMQAVLRLGAAYVPIDPHGPPAGSA
ncbi:AMP-binding protein [Kribbella sp. NBC_00359]|uniref:AMP-binding protein n=1 Tax=Kribbella sp. NBC_00359 TaxID=2975966 RepID=UPI002E23FD00